MLILKNPTNLVLAGISASALTLGLLFAPAPAVAEEAVAPVETVSAGVLESDSSAQASDPSAARLDSSVTNNAVAEDASASSASPDSSGSMASGLTKADQTDGVDAVAKSKDALGSEASGQRDAASSAEYAIAGQASESATATSAAVANSLAVSPSSSTNSKESSKVPVYRLYNPYTGEHLFTEASSEATNLIPLGWQGESVAWFVPGSSSTKAFRLYNPYTGEHHYTTNADEYNYLATIGWRQEGSSWLSSDEEEVPIYRLFNPYAKRYTHHFTKDEAEYNYLATLGWQKENIAWYGASVPSDGWFVTSNGDELDIQDGVVMSDKVVSNKSGQKRYLTSAGFVAKGSTWSSPSNGCTYVTSSDGTITQTINPRAGLDYCWLKDSSYWSGAGVVKELLMNKHYSKGRYGQSISKIVIHHNAGNLSTESIYQTWQTRAASAHYQVEGNGTVGQLVLDCDTAWQAGNWTINTQTIGIEHADYVDSNGRWRMTKATINSGARLVAALCLQYKLGRPQWGVNTVGHNECTSTECPASLAVGGSQHDEYVAKAQEWYDKLSRL